MTHSRAVAATATPARFRNVDAQNCDTELIASTCSTQSPAPSTLRKWNEEDSVQIIFPNEAVVAVLEPDVEPLVVTDTLSEELALCEPVVDMLDVTELDNVVD